MLAFVLAASKVPPPAVNSYDAPAGIEHRPAAGTAANLDRTLEIRKSQEGMFGLSDEA